MSTETYNRQKFEKSRARDDPELSTRLGLF